MTLFPFDPFFLLAGLAAALVGLSKGGLPSIGMLAVPLLSLVMSPVKAAALLLPIYVVSDVAGIWLYRRNFSMNNLRILVPAGFLGVVIGWLTAAYVSDRVITLMIGLMGVSFCLNVWLRNHAAALAKPVQTSKGWFWGMLAGFTSFIAHAGGPPFQIYMLPQKLPKAQFAGTSTLFFATINVAKILPYQNLRPYSPDVIWSAALLIPFALIGAVMGAQLNRRIPDFWFYRIVQVSLFVVSLKLIEGAVLHSA